MLDVRFNESSQQSKQWAARVLKALHRGLLRATDAGMRLIVNETIRRLRAGEPHFMRRRTSAYAKQIRGRARRGRAKFSGPDLIVAALTARRGYIAALEYGGSYEQIVRGYTRQTAAGEHDVRRHTRTRTERTPKHYLGRGSKAAKVELPIPYERAIGIAFRDARIPKTSELYRGLRGARIKV